MIDQKNTGVANRKVEAVDTEYCINDYRINELPDKNPLQNIIDDFVRRRSHYNYLKQNSSSSLGSSKSSSTNSAANPKPQLEDFLAAFET